MALYYVIIVHLFVVINGVFSMEQLFSPDLQSSIFQIMLMWFWASTTVKSSSHSNVKSSPHSTVKSSPNSNMKSSPTALWSHLPTPLWSHLPTPLWSHLPTPLWSHLPLQCEVISPLHCEVISPLHWEVISPLHYEVISPLHCEVISPLHCFKRHCLQSEYSLTLFLATLLLQKLTMLTMPPNWLKGLLHPVPYFLAAYAMCSWLGESRPWTPLSCPVGSMQNIKFGENFLYWGWRVGARQPLMKNLPRPPWTFKPAYSAALCCMLLSLFHC